MPAANSAAQMRRATLRDRPGHRPPISGPSGLGAQREQLAAPPGPTTSISGTTKVIDRDPALSATPAYFDLLKTTAATPSGSPKDRFHFTQDTAEWLAFSQSGVSAGYGRGVGRSCLALRRAASPWPTRAGVASGRGRVGAWP